MSQRFDYLLIFRDSTPEAYRALSAGQQQSLLQQWNDWRRKLLSQEKLHWACTLSSEGGLVSGATGCRVTEIAVSPATEALEGCLALTLGSFAEAVAIAQQCPGLPYGMTVEVRPIAGASPSRS